MCTCEDMKPTLYDQLLNIAHQRISGDDPSHDIHHTLRVLANARRIAEAEGADIDVIVPAALFHDLIMYPKDDPRSLLAPDESAAEAGEILVSIAEYPQDKIPKVMRAIRLCSFTKGAMPEELEAKILQDADGLEATGAISIMRTFASAGQMQHPFYHPDDPFATNRTANGKSYALDLFYERLLKVGDRMHTSMGRQIAERRTQFLRDFLDEFEVELSGK